MILDEILNYVAHCPKGGHPIHATPAYGCNSLNTLSKPQKLLLDKAVKKVLQFYKETLDMLKDN